MTSTLDICYSKNPHDRSYLDIYLPEGAVKSVFLYFHGGGIVEGKKSFPLKDRLLAEQVAVVCANYRLYPNAKFPEFIEDCAEAAAWVKNHPEKLGGCNKIFVGGSSAGAYLSMMLYFDNRYLNKHGLSCKDFAGFIFDAGQPTAHFSVLKERGVDSRKILLDETAPMFFVEEYDAQPDMLIFVADNDMACRLEQTDLFVRYLKRYGYPTEKIRYILMQDCKHCSYINPASPASPYYINEILKFMNEVCV